MDIKNIRKSEKGERDMGIPDNYEVNVALKRNPEDQYGIHWCKIQLPETLEEKAEEKLEAIRAIFGENYHISMVHWECRGKHKDEWD